MEELEHEEPARGLGNAAVFGNLTTCLLSCWSFMAVSLTVREIRPSACPGRRINDGISPSRRRRRSDVSPGDRHGLPQCRYASARAAVTPRCGNCNGVGNGIDHGQIVSESPNRRLVGRQAKARASSAQRPLSPNQPEGCSNRRTRLLGNASESSAQRQRARVAPRALTRTGAPDIRLKHQHIIDDGTARGLFAFEPRVATELHGATNALRIARAQ